MLERLKTLFKNHKTTILISLGTSFFAVATLIIAFGVVFVLNRSYFVGVLDSLLGRSLPLTENRDREPVKRDIPTEESRIIEVVEQAKPAVVSIVITKDIPIIERYYQEFDPFGDNFFKDFFGGGLRFRLPIPQQKQNGTEKQQVGGGSGFFVSADGYIVTNKHVVDDDKAEYTVITNDGKKYPAEILAKDSSLDVAVLRIKGDNFPYLVFGDSDKLKVGQTVIAIGNALAEFPNTVSVGVISGLSRSITAGDSFGRSEHLEGVIQTDAAINPGNSGGPLLDIKGRVIGVNVAVSQGAENIGFALASNTVKGIVESVRKYGEIIRPYLGVRYLQITESLKEKNNLPVDYGVLVVRGETPEELAVIPGSPADKAGIVENDIILEVDGIKLEPGKSLSSIIRQKQIGETVKLKILHRGEEKIIEVKLEKAPKNF